MPRGRPQSLRGSIRAVKDATGKVIRYEGTINLGKDETGTYRRQVLTGRTKKEVQAKLDSALDALQHAVTTKRHITALAFFDEWLRYVQANNRPSTYHSYEMTVRNHILPNLKPTLRLIDIDKQEVRQIVHAIRIVKGPSRTLEYATSVIIRAFNDAVEWGYLKENPAIGAVKVEEYQRREITVLTSEEVGKFLSTVRAQPRGELFVLLYGLIFLAGFRRGEALGVGYDDLDPRRKTVTISGAVQRVQHQGVKRLAPKTKKSRRTVWVPEDLFDALWAYRAKQVEPDATWNRDRLLFVTRNGTPLSPVNLHRHFKAALEAADLPTTVRIHDGRHTCATLLMEGDVNPKIVQEILGHSSVVLTLDTYSHVSGESQRRALNTLSVSLDQLLINSSISEADSDEDADESLFDEE